MEWINNPVVVYVLAAFVIGYVLGKITWHGNPKDEKDASKWRTSRIVMTTPLPRGGYTELHNMDLESMYLMAMYSSWYLDDVLDIGLACFMKIGRD